MMPKTNQFKSVHWKALGKAVHGTGVWKTDAEQPDLDLKELETLFQKEEPKPKSARLPSPREKKMKEVVQLVETKRAYNLSIKLAAIKKLKHEGIRSALLRMDDCDLSVEALETLKEAMPSREEVRMIEGHKGDPTLLGTVEQFFLVIKDVPRLAQRIKVMLFRATLDERIASIRATLGTVDAAIKSVMASKDFKLLLQTVLASGNHLNAGTYRGGAAGFHLETLLQLRDVKSGVDRKVSLLHFVVRQVLKRSATAALLSSELAATKKVLNLNLQIATGQVESLTNGYASVEREISNHEQDGSPTATSVDLDRFHEATATFCTDAQIKVHELKQATETTLSNLRELALYFGDTNASSTPSASDDPLANLKIVGSFLTNYDAVIKDVQKEQKEQSRKVQSRPRSANCVAGLATPSSSSSSSTPLSRNDAIFAAIRRRGESFGYGDDDD